MDVLKDAKKLNEAYTEIAPYTWPSDLIVVASLQWNIFHVLRNS